MKNKVLVAFLTLMLVAVPLFAACVARPPEEEGAPVPPEVIKLKYANYFLMIVGAILMSYSIPLSGDGRDWYYI